MPAKRLAVHEAIAVWKPVIVCLQETKISSWYPAMAREIGGSLLDQTFHIPTAGTRGGISLFWNSVLVQTSDLTTIQFNLTANIRLLTSHT